MAEEIPFDRLGIPEALRKNVAADAPNKAKYAVAKGLLPTTADAQLAICYLLATDPHPKVAAAARKTLGDMPPKTLLGAISMNTHPKILEFVAEFCEPAKALDERLLFHRRCNDRTAVLIAQRADFKMAETISNHHQRLLMTPEVFSVLYANPACTDALIEKMKSFMSLHNSLPMVPSVRPIPGAKEAAPQKKRGELTKDVDFLAEETDDAPSTAREAIENAMDELTDPGIDAFHTQTDAGDFKFNFEDELSEFSWELIQEQQAELEEEERVPLEKYINELPMGKKIKLAYTGNGEARKILIRDRNKIVATAVLKSGKCSDPEIVSFAGNRNLDAAVAREIARNPEWVRKYSIRVALVSNSKTPVQLAMGWLNQLSKRDLKAISLNRNVAPPVAKRAKQLVKVR